MSPVNPTHPNLVSDAREAENQIREVISAHKEWFMSIDGRPPLSVNNDEFDFSVAQSRLIFSSWTEIGSQTWRVNAWNWTGDKLILQASRRMGAESATIELVPRASAKTIVASIAAARQERCERLAQLVALSLEGAGRRGSGVVGTDQDHESKTRSWHHGDSPSPLHPKPQTLHPNTDLHLHPTPFTQQPSVKIERAALSPGMRRDQPGRYARIILRLPHERIAVAGTVARSDARNVDSLFSSVLLWFNRSLSSPKKPPINRLLMIVEHGILETARQRHVLLRDSLRARVELLEIDDDWKAVEATRPWERKYIWRKRLNRFPTVRQDERHDLVNEIVATRPEAIDVVAARHGQTLRYHGLPFARVRCVMDRDRVWFGIEGSPRRSLDEYHQQDWLKLLHDLETYRNAECRDRRHWLHRAAGEAWLESILRRDITRLDPGLIVAPLHAQFRTSHSGPTGARPIDLLALRHDGRLVVIELKVNEDREHVFQGVDYWRRVEAHRRRGHISSAKLFGDREISDETPLVYLVAPTLRFHPSFRTLAGMIAPDIEVYRFDINEDWRGGVRVVRRDRVNA
ncbi:MAG: hypothetical protein DMF72_09715 [Acidobacteria bacterium]|nr:MAG: hypothetical protein DMF72_09715 [Acidobacteriota bacterium]